MNPDDRVLQVFYRRSNEMDVSGLFVLNTNDTLAVFGSTIILFSLQTNGTYNAYIQASKPSTNLEHFVVPGPDPYTTEPLAAKMHLQISVLEISRCLGRMNCHAPRILLE